MARTSNLKHTGRAASAELAEQQLRIYQMQDATIANNKRNFGMALDELKAVDPAGWEEWYDNDDNVPANFPGWLDTAGIENVVEIIYGRICDLEAAAADAQYNELYINAAADIDGGEFI